MAKLSPELFDATVDMVVESLEILHKWSHNMQVMADNTRITPEVPEPIRVTIADYLQEAAVVLHAGVENISLGIAVGGAPQNSEDELPAYDLTNMKIDGGKVN